MYLHMYLFNIHICCDGQLVDNVMNLAQVQNSEHEIKMAHPKSTTSTTNNRTQSATRPIVTIQGRFRAKWIINFYSSNKYSFRSPGGFVRDLGPKQKQ